MDRIAGEFTGSYTLGVRVYDRISCKKCSGQCTTFVSSSWVMVLVFLMVLLALLSAISYYILKSPIIMWILLALMIASGVFFVVEVCVNPLVGIDPDGKSTLCGSLDYKEANAKVSVNSARDIKAYRIYGIKFDNETQNAKFHERFRDGLVPAVFHEKKKGSNAFEVRIIGKKFVPEELLHIGSEFLVEDNDQFICRGTVTEIFSDVE